MDFVDSRPSPVLESERYLEVTKITIGCLCYFECLSLIIGHSSLCGMLKFGANLTL